MAEEDAQEGAQEETPQAGAGDQKQQVSGGSKLVPIIIIVVVLLAIVGGVGFYFFVLNGSQSSMETGSAEEAKFIDLYRKRSQPSVESIKGEGLPVFSSVFSYSVNMKDQRHMMQVSFKAKAYDELVLAHLKRFKPLIDNNMMMLLGQWKAEDLRNRAGLELLKQAIYKELNSHFDQEFIESDDHKSRDRTPIKEILIVEYYIN